MDYCCVGTIDHYGECEFRFPRSLLACYVRDILDSLSIESDVSRDQPSSIICCGLVSYTNGLCTARSLTLWRMTKANGDRRDHESTRIALLRNACLKRSLAGRIVCVGAVVVVKLPSFRHGGGDTNDEADDEHPRENGKFGGSSSRSHRRQKERTYTFHVSDVATSEASFSSPHHNNTDWMSGSPSANGRKNDEYHACSPLCLVLPGTLITIRKDDREKQGQIDQRREYGNEISSATNKSNQASLKDEALVEGKEDENLKDDDGSSRAMRTLLETIKMVRDCRTSTRSVVNELSAPSAMYVSKSFLLTGPPGVGKTHAVRMAVESASMSCLKRIPLTCLRGSELLGGCTDVMDAVRSLQRVFCQAAELSISNGVSVLFLDECDGLVASSPTSTSSLYLSLALAELLDRVSCTGRNGNDDVANRGFDGLVVVAATNRMDSIPVWLRRPGRFDREILMMPPGVEERTRILRSLLSSSSSSFDTATVVKTIDLPDLRHVARLCVGYVAADLAALVRHATLASYDPKYRRGKNGDNGSGSDGGVLVPGLVDRTMLERSMKEVKASALRDAALSAPPMTRWEDIAPDSSGAKEALRRVVEWSTRTGTTITTEAYRNFRGLVRPPRAVLLHGPPGCAKTSLARAAAGSSGLAFLSLSPAEVYSSSYVGEAEAVIRRAFALGRSLKPCVLFFDEIDAILGMGGDASGSNGSGRMDRTSSSAESRVLSTFLNEMDGIDSNRPSQENNSNNGDGDADALVVLGATNRPWTLDAALLRPGRFDLVLYVSPPDRTARSAILRTVWTRAQLNEHKHDHNHDHEPFPFHILDRYADDDMSGHMTGAEIVGACHEAFTMAVRARDRGDGGTLSSDFCFRDLTSHLDQAFADAKPLLRTDPQLLQDFEHFQQKHGARNQSKTGR